MRHAEPLQLRPREHNRCTGELPNNGGTVRIVPEYLNNGDLKTEAPPPHRSRLRVDLPLATSKDVSLVQRFENIEVIERVQRPVHGDDIGVGHVRTALRIKID